MGTGLQNTVYDAEITVTQSASGTFAAAIQLQGANGEDLTQRGAVDFYVSTDAEGDDLATTSTDITSLAIGNDGVAIELSSNVAGKLISESDGDIDLAIVVPDSKEVYLILVMPDGRLIPSDAMTYGM